MICYSGKVQTKTGDKNKLYSNEHSFKQKAKREALLPLLLSVSLKTCEYKYLPRLLGHPPLQKKKTNYQRKHL